MATLTKLGAIGQFESVVQVRICAPKCHTHTCPVSGSATCVGAASSRCRTLKDYHYRFRGSFSLKSPHVLGLSLSVFLSSPAGDALDITDGDVQLDAIERGRVIHDLLLKNRLFLQEHEDLDPAATPSKPAWHLEDRPSEQQQQSQVQLSDGKTHRRGSWEENIENRKPEVESIEREVAGCLKQSKVLPPRKASIPGPRVTSGKSMAGAEDNTGGVNTSRLSAKNGVKVPPGTMWSLPHVIYGIVHYIFVESIFGFYFDMLQSVLSAWACIIYVYATYNVQEIELKFDYFDLFDLFDSVQILIWLSSLSASSGGRDRSAVGRGAGMGVVRPFHL